MMELSTIPSFSGGGGGGGVWNGPPPPTAFGNITADDFLALMIGNISTMSAPAGQQSLQPAAINFNDTFGFNGSLVNGSFISGLEGNTSGNGSRGTSTTQLPGVYPSGYTLPHIVFASIVVTILMVIIVVGNMLVIIAIATEKSLKNIQNWFIASLAVADFFLGLVIMPFSLANELMGYWVFGTWWCDIHSAMDVLLSTASIMNLCLISLDRYWSITKAIEYLKTRTPARAAIMITAVWIMSGLICIPPLLGWKVKQPDGPLPQCLLSEDLGYVLYSALGSFYIPSCIMVFVYIRIYFAAKRRARRGIKKLPRKPAGEQVTSFTTSPNKGTRPMPSVPSTSQVVNHPDGKTNGNPTNSSAPIATIEAPPVPSQQIPIPIVTCDFASDISTSEACDNNEGSCVKDTLKVSASGQQQPARSPSNGLATPASSEMQMLSPSPTHVGGRCRALSLGVDTDMVSEFDPSSSDSGVVSRCANVKPLKFKFCQPLFGKTKTHKKKDNAASLQQQVQQHQMLQHHHSHKLSDVAELEPAIPKVQKQRDPEKEKRRIARKKEKRATLILGLIMGSFIACWLPFFFLYILTPLCHSCNIPESAFSVAFWLGYMNSALNPAIYTIFNKDFRRAFRRILFK